MLFLAQQKGHETVLYVPIIHERSSASWAQLALAAMLLIGLPHGARAAATAWIGDKHAAVRLVTAVQATGSESRIDTGLEIRMASGWHSYWRTPGDAGFAPTIDWKDSSNVAPSGKIRRSTGLPSVVALRASSSCISSRRLMKIR